MQDPRAYSILDQRAHMFSLVGHYTSLTVQTRLPTCSCAKTSLACIYLYTLEELINQPTRSSTTLEADLTESCLILSAGATRPLNGMGLVIFMELYASSEHCDTCWLRTSWPVAIDQRPINYTDQQPAK